MRRCVVSFCTADQLYYLGLIRLRILVGARRKIDFLGYNTPAQLPKEIPRSLDSVYSYKPWLLDYARRLGYRQAFWMDTSIVIHDLTRLFKIVDEQGYYLFQTPFQIEQKVTVSQRSSDECLSALNLDREEALKIPQFSAGCIGLDFGNDLAVEFLEQFKKYSVDGVSIKGYKGLYDPVKEMNVRTSAFGSDHPDYLGHRHDQSVGSTIIHRLGMSLTPQDYSLMTVDRSPKGKNVLGVLARTLQHLMKLRVEG